MQYNINRKCLYSKDSESTGWLYFLALLLFFVAIAGCSKETDVVLPNKPIPTVAPENDPLEPPTNPMDEKSPDNPYWIPPEERIDFCQFSEEQINNFSNGEIMAIYMQVHMDFEQSMLNWGTDVSEARTIRDLMVLYVKEYQKNECAPKKSDNSGTDSGEPESAVESD